MEAPWRNEPESASGSETDSLYRDPKETSDVPIVENSFVEETDKDDETIADNEKNEYKEELRETECQDGHESGVFESLNGRGITDEISDINKMFRRRLMLDAEMRSPPKEDFWTSQPGNIGPRTNIMLNTKALSIDARTYELEKFQKNRLIIFNQVAIDGFNERLGTDQDVKALTETFVKFGFDVKEKKNFTKEKIIEVFETFKTTNFTDYGCIGIVVLTHGSFNGSLRAKDQAYNESEIIDYFKVYDKPTLSTKAKFLLVQACRGTLCLPGVEVQSTNNMMTDPKGEMEPYIVPVVSDTLIVHSSYVGEVSTRDELHGTWFIQAICSKINELWATHDLESILTEVKHDVATNRYWKDYNLSTSRVETFKQMPTVTSTLTRKLYLRKFGDEPPLNSLNVETFLDISKPTTSANSVLHTATTPTLYRLVPCCCFLDHFDYIKKCLTYFVERSPLDTTARTFLNISDAFENENQFNAAKQRMAKAICDHLSHNAQHYDFFKYLYFYKH